MNDKKLMQPVLMGDLVAATEALAEEIDNKFLNKETAALMYATQEDMKGAFKQTIELVQDQSKYFSNVLGAITFVLAHENMITEEEFQTFTSPEFDTHKFLRDYIYRTTGGAVDLDAEESNITSDEDNIPIGQA